MNWAQLCGDKNLQDLPYKIELNRQGQIILSPTRNRHAFYQGRIAVLLQKLRPHGYVLTGCGVDTKDGTKVADVTWASNERFQVIKDEFSCSIAPEICVEILSPSNTWEEMMGKRQLFLERQAIEYWLCDEAGQMRFFDRTGELKASRQCPDFPFQIEE